MEQNDPPRRPVPAVAAVIVEDDNLLLIRRGTELSKGKWSIPGGSVEWGETLAEALVREVREETGLEIAVGPLAAVFDLVIRKDGGISFHYVILDYFAKQTGGTLIAGDDADEARWVPTKELDRYDLAEHLRERLHEMGIG